MGGARATGANGLVGLEDHVSVIGGQLVVGSPSGRGTRIKCDVAPGEGIIRYSPSAIATPASAQHPPGLRWLDTYQGQRGLSQVRDENDARPSGGCQPPLSNARRNFDHLGEPIVAISAPRGDRRL
jgi:hypothetical protein